MLRSELDRQYQHTYQSTVSYSAELIHEQLKPRDHIIGNMASKLNVHGAALMELTSTLAELNSNKGGIHLKTRVDRLERQIVDYSFLLEGVEKNDELPLELMVVELIRKEFEFDVEARDVDLAVRFGSHEKKPRTILVTMVSRWMKRSIISSKKVLKNTGYKIRDFLPEEVLDLLYAANAERIAENLESCWPARGGVCLKFDQNSKPQHVGSIRELRTVLSHVIAVRGSSGGANAASGSTTPKPQQPQQHQEANMDTSERTDNTPCPQGSQPAQQPPNITTPNATSQQTGALHTQSGIDLEKTSPSNVTIDPNLPATHDIKHSFTDTVFSTPSKADIKMIGYQSLWGDRTPLRKYSASVQLELNTSQSKLDEACLGFEDKLELNNSWLSPFTKSSTPAKERKTPGSVNGKSKFTSPPKMQFSKLNVKPVKSPLAVVPPGKASPTAIASPTNATSATAKTKATSGQSSEAEAGTSDSTKTHEMAESSTIVHSANTNSVHNSGQQGNKQVTPQSHSNAATANGVMKQDGYSPYVVIKSPTK